MKYTDIENNSLTEKEMYRILVNAVRAGVEPAMPIYIYLSFEKLDEFIKSTYRVIPGKNFGSIVYDFWGGEVTIEAIKNKTDTITVSN